MIDNTTPSNIRPNTGFFQAIARACADTRVEKVIEIGAGAGDGATQAILSSLRNKPQGNIAFAALELSKVKYDQLVSALAAYTWATPFLGNEVDDGDYPNIEMIGEFYWDSEGATAFRKRRLKLDIWRQLEEELDYLTKRTGLVNGTLSSAIATIGTDIDFVLMNGSEFTGEQQWDIIAELDSPLYVAMNGTNSMQNHVRALALEADTTNWRVFASGTLDGYDWKIFKYIGA